MVHIARVKVNWTGIPTGPGYTNLYFRNTTPGLISQATADNAVAKVDTWLDTWVGAINNTISFLVDPTIEVIEDTTGALQGFLTTVPDGTRQGIENGGYSAGVG